MKNIWLDKYNFFDEKKIFGFLYLSAALASIFVLATSPEQLAILLAVGVALYLGVPIGEVVAPIGNLPGLGLFDLITNKANKGDPYRLFGAIFLVSGMAYNFSPLWINGFIPHWELLGLTTLTGLALLGVALLGDKVTTNNPVVEQGK